MESLKIHVIKGQTPLAQGAYDQLSLNFDNADLQEVSNPLSADVRLVLGGDGTMLHQAQGDIERDDLPPLFGIKAGHEGSVGFLLNAIDFDVAPDELVQTIRESIDTRFRFLEADLGDDGKIYAFNEINTRRASGMMEYSEVDITDKETTITLPGKGDGLLVCTAQGSTAYNRAAGGSIFTDRNNIQVTGICAPTFGSLNLSQGASVDIRRTQDDKRPRGIECDGKTVPWPETLEVIKMKLSNRFTMIKFSKTMTHTKKLMQQVLR